MNEAPLTDEEREELERYRLEKQKAEQERIELEKFRKESSKPEILETKKSSTSPKADFVIPGSAAYPPKTSMNGCWIAVIIITIIFAIIGAASSGGSTTPHKSQVERDADAIQQKDREENEKFMREMRAQIEVQRRREQGR